MKDNRINTMGLNTNNEATNACLHEGTTVTGQVEQGASYTPEELKAFPWLRSDAYGGCLFKPGELM